MNKKNRFSLLLFRGLFIMMVFVMHESIFAETAKERFFGTSAFMSARISPDGKTIAQIGSDDSGIPNVFLTSRDNSSSRCIRLTFFETPQPIQFFWSADSNKVLVLKDENGTGRLNLHGFDIRSKEHFVYTEKFSKVNAKVIQVSSTENKAVIGLNNRNPHFHDLYILDLDSGDFTLLFENDIYAKFLVSKELKLILKMRVNDDGSWTVFTDKDEVFVEFGAEEAFHTNFISYDIKKNLVYMLDNRFSNTNQLIEKSLSKPSREKVLGASPDSDIDEVLFLDGEPKAYASYYTQKKWHILDPSVKEDMAFLEERVGSNFELVNQSKDGKVWIISNSIPDKGNQFWIYDRHLHHLSLLYCSGLECSKMYEMVVKARDGETLVCYYTLPKEHDRGGVVDSPLPLVVVPHGGPFGSRDKFEFNPYHQWLASCGYAVLSVNFRLSSGFGKAFVNAGNGQWGGKAHLDVVDAVEACIAKGITEKGRLAILGRSYGGYESLAALTFSPEYFTCCVSFCGPSNLKTVLNNVPKYWELTSLHNPLSGKTWFYTKQAFIKSMGGDPDEAEGAKYLEKCSPLNYLDNIKVPLLLVHGKNDHIVSERESRQIYESMKKNNKEVAYILFPDEGHRFNKFSNKMMIFNCAEQFLSQHLHGKYQPSDPKILANSSAEIFN